MGLVVDFRQMLKIQMGIDLRGRDAGMPQQLLHGAQITRGLQQVTGATVAQFMGITTVLSLPACSATASDELQSPG